jgi:hypothetical protein
LASVSAVHLKQAQAENCQQCYCSSELSGLQTQITALSATISQLETAQAEHTANEDSLRAQIESLGTQVTNLEASQKESATISQSPVYELLFTIDQGPWETNEGGNPQNWEVVSPFNQEINLQSEGLVVCSLNAQINTFNNGQVYVTLFIDGQPMLGEANYGSANKQTNDWNTVNMVQSSQAGAGSHYISLQEIYSQSWGLAGTSLQCFVIYQHV